MTRPPIAIVTTYYSPVVGGAEAAAQRLAEFLCRRGHRVTVLTKRTSHGLPTREIAGNIEIERLGPVAERSGRGKWVFVPWALRALLRRREAAVVCCIDYRAIGLAALVARALTKAPVVFQAQTEGVMSAARLRQWLARLGMAPHGRVAHAATWFVRALYGRADAIACISHALEREAVDCGMPRERVHYLPNPVGARLFAVQDAQTGRLVRERIGIPPDAVVAAFVGRLSREKGVLELVRAWARVRPQAHLVVIGPPMKGHPWDVSQEAHSVVERENLADTVHFLGGQPIESVADWLHASNFAVQPSHFEAMGLAAAEAMAAGLPVIATDTGGYRDFVIHGETGWLVPVGNADALASALARFVADAPLRERLGANARRMAAQFDERIVLERFAVLIDRLAAAR